MKIIYGNRYSFSSRVENFDVGHSYGCSVAAAMALQDTANIKALVLIGSPCMYYEEYVQKSAFGDVISMPIFGRGLAFVIGKSIAKKTTGKDQ